MIKSDKVEFARAFTACYMAFDKEPNEDQMRVYFDLLSDHKVDDVCLAFRKHIKDPDRGRFFPKVADLIYQITGTEKQQGESLEALAELQWAQIYRASANGVEPGNITVEARSALRSIGGCQKVGYSLEKDVPFLKRDFIALFKSITKASIDQLDESLPCYALLVSKKTQVAVK